VATRVLLAVVGLLAGGWMIMDGVHVMLRGKYIGPEKPGPWSIAFVKFGIDPFRLGPMFVAFGALWLVFLAATLAGQTWGKYGAASVALASLWYLPLGTVLSLIYLAILYFKPIR
jgi:hypothetical protein